MSPYQEEKDGIVSLTDAGVKEIQDNFGYDSRGSADPRESLRKRRILKLALTAHKVLSAQALLPAAVL